jgi:hypothetical protein
LSLIVGLLPSLLMIGAWFPPSWRLAVVGLTPAVALCAVAGSRGRLSLGIDWPIDRRPTLAGAFFGSMAGSASYLFQGGGRFYWTDVTWRWAAVAMVVGCAIALLVALLDRKAMSDLLMIILTGLIAFAWLSGVIVAIDLNGPVGARVLTPTVVATKSHYSGRGGSSWDATLRTADGKYQETVPIRSEVYDLLAVGKPWCLVRGKGILGIWWRDSVACPVAALTQP